MLTHYSLLSLSFKGILLFAPILTTYLFLGFQAHGCSRLTSKLMGISHCSIQWALSILLLTSRACLHIPLTWLSGLDFLPAFFPPSRRLSSDFLPALVLFNLLNIGVLWGPGHAPTFSVYVLFNHHHSR